MVFFTTKRRNLIILQITTDKQNGHETEDDLRAQITSLQQDLKQYQDMIGEYHVSEQTRKREVDSALITAREVVERERREKLDVLSDRKSREEQFEHLSKTLSVLKVRGNFSLIVTDRKHENKKT